MEKERSEVLMEVRGFLERAAPKGSKSWAKEHEEYGNQILSSQKRVTRESSDADFRKDVKSYVGAWFQAFEAFVCEKHESGTGLDLTDVWHASKFLKGYELDWKGIRFLVGPRSTAAAGDLPVVSAAEVMLLQENEVCEDGKIAILNTKSVFPGARIESITRDGVTSRLVPEVLS